MNKKWAAVLLWVLIPLAIFWKSVGRSAQTVAQPILDASPVGPTLENEGSVVFYSTREDGGTPEEAPWSIDLGRLERSMEDLRTVLEKLQGQLQAHEALLQKMVMQQQQFEQEREATRAEKADGLEAQAQAIAALQQAYAQILKGNSGAASQLSAATAWLEKVPGGSAIEAREEVRRALEALMRNDMLAARQYTEWALFAISSWSPP